MHWHYQATWYKPQTQSTNNIDSVRQQLWQISASRSHAFSQLRRLHIELPVFSFRANSIRQLTFLYVAEEYNQHCQLLMKDHSESSPALQPVSESGCHKVAPN